MKTSSKHSANADAATLLYSWRGEPLPRSDLSVQLLVLPNLLLASHDSCIILLDATNAQVKLIVVRRLLVCNTQISSKSQMINALLLFIVGLVIAQSTAQGHLRAFHKLKILHTS